MIHITRSIPEIQGATHGCLPLAELLSTAQPRVLRGLVGEWPATHAARRSEREIVDYIRSFYNGKAIGYSIGGPEIEGRLFYNEDFTKLNFAAERAPLDEILFRILGHAGDPRPPTIYVGSALIDS